MKRLSEFHPPRSEVLVLMAGRPYDATGDSLTRPLAALIRLDTHSFKIGDRAGVMEDGLLSIIFEND
jgi:hypothetical protein